MNLQLEFYDDGRGLVHLLNAVWPGQWHDGGEFFEALYQWRVSKYALLVGPDPAQAMRKAALAFWAGRTGITTDSEWPNDSSDFELGDLAVIENGIRFTIYGAGNLEVVLPLCRQGSEGQWTYVVRWQSDDMLSASRTCTRNVLMAAVIGGFAKAEDQLLLLLKKHCFF